MKCDDKDKMLSLTSFRLTNANPPSQLPVNAILKKHGKEKERACNSTTMNVEHETFTQLFFSLIVGEGPETSMFHKYITQKIANKTTKNMKKFNHRLDVNRLS